MLTQEPEGSAIHSLKFLPLIAMLTSGLLLGSCSDASGLKALERPATPNDALPEGVNFGPDTNLDKVLLVAEANGTRELEASGWARIHNNILVSDG